MKNLLKMKTLAYSISLCLLSLSLLATESPSGIEKKAQVKLEAPIDANIEIDANNTDLLIDIWDEPRIEVEAVFRYRGEKHLEKLGKFAEEFQELVEAGISKSGNSVRIETYRSTPEKMKIGFKDFIIFQTTFSKDEVQIEYRIKMPAQGKVNVKHSYRDLRINGDVKDLNLSQYSGRLSLDRIDNAVLVLKYGEASVRELKIGKVQLYENDLSVENLGELDLNIKYSQFRCRAAAKMKVVAYESELELEGVKDVEGNFKYSRFQSAKIEALKVTSYESRFKAMEVVDAILDNSKYSRYEFGNVNNVKVGQAYEDRMELREVRTMDAGNSKYCSHEIRSLDKAYKMDGYECLLRIDQLSGPKGDITINGKYLKVKINTEEAVYDLTASLQYGSIDYRNSPATAEIREEGNKTIGRIQSKARKEGGGYNILLNGYEMQVELY